MTLIETILAIVEIIVIVGLSIFLFVSLRKTKMIRDHEKTQRSDSAGIMNITPVETRLVSFEMKSQDIALIEPAAIAPYIGAEKTGLKLEDELPEEEPSKEERKEEVSEKVPEEQAIKQKAKKIPVPDTEKVKPGKKGSREKKPANKQPEKAAKIKEEAPPEKIPNPETEEVKPKKKEIKRKKPPGKEPGKPAEIKEETKATPVKKTVKKEKSEKKPSKKKGREKLVT